MNSATTLVEEKETMKHTNHSILRPFGGNKNQ